ncbi:hypothetical protein CAPTEDRAFT_184124 [Capitella teleta]|uniref:G-protein coupled receptors family 1 profile domain-containing protein n=1 Tax=Capitella teleta TaxID=283909 RepID=R7UGH4_CAPTE|nr:hypothetical protein CAPTEDRAFT_184124 [Capitella teleta]|eukprot:ELU05629.1 hypothetical protein CAPTEDRAFT_184124 [Capitella teleta]
MQIYIFPLLVIGGTVGHALTIAVLIRPRMRHTSIYFYLLALSCSDTVVLWVSCFKAWVRMVTGFELLHVSGAACKSVTFLYLTSTYLSSWLIVCMTVDRFIAVWFPFKVASICSVRHARISTALLLSVALFSNFHVFWTFRIEKNRCTYDHESISMAQVFEYLKLAAYCFVPFVIVLVLNAGIIHKLKWGAAMLRRRKESNCVHDRIVCLLLTVSFAWFLLTLPVSLLGFVQFLHNSNIARSVVFILMYSNHSINFYLYCLTGKKFRHELKAVFRCRKVKRQRFSFHNGGPIETTKSMTKTDYVENIPLTLSRNARPRQDEMD